MEKKMRAFEANRMVIQRYEEELPDMLLGAHEDYEHGNIDEEAYANALRKIYDLIEMLYVEREDK